MYIDMENSPILTSLRQIGKKNTGLYDVTFVVRHIIEKQLSVSVLNVTYADPITQWRIVYIVFRVVGVLLLQLWNCPTPITNEQSK